MKRRSQGETRQRRQPVDDEFKISLAMERYAAPMREVRELAKKYSRAEGVVSRAIIGAFEDGLVEVHRVKRRAPLTRRSDIEVALKRRYGGLLRAIVINATPEGADALHVRLGEALADEIGSTTYFRHRETIALGAGRSIYHTASRLVASEEKLGSENVAIVSLCGNSYPYHDAHDHDASGFAERGDKTATDDPEPPTRYRNICLDADANVILLAQAFEQRVQIAVTSHPIFLAESDKAVHDHYYDQLWLKRPPSVAIAGIGIFNERHQLMELCLTRQNRELLPPIYMPEGVHKDISELFKADQQMSSILGEPHTSVAEMSMRLFFVEPPINAAGHEAHALRTRIETLIQQVNNRLFSAHPTHLRQIGSITVVAGGTGKVGAIRTLLDTNDPKLVGERLSIDTLCTDSACAELLLSTTN